MSNVLFINIPLNGHVNPTLGLVNELVKQGEQVTYFCSEKYKERIEKVGATFKSYGEKAFFPNNNKDTSKNESIQEHLFNGLSQVLKSCEETLPIIMEQIKGIKFDYIVHSHKLPLGYFISQILKVPSISSFAEFATAKELMAGIINEKQIKDYALTDNYIKLTDKLDKIYNVKMPTNIFDLFFIKGDLNIAYTSKFFLAHPESFLVREVRG